jgi:hypothetical protein
MAPPLKTLESVRSASGQARAEGLIVSVIFDLMAVGLEPPFRREPDVRGAVGYVGADGNGARAARERPMRLAH